MDLLELGQGPEAAIVFHRAEARQKQRPISLHVGRGVMRCKTEIEAVSAVAGRDASMARAESVYQPRQIGEGLRA